MRKPIVLALVAFLGLSGAAMECFAVPLSRAPDAKALISGSWSMSLVPGEREPLRFFAVEGADSGRLYLRRFMTPSFYVDALSGADLRVLLLPEPTSRKLAFAADGDSFVRETSPASIEYKRAAAAAGSASGLAKAAQTRSSSYEGDWEIGDIGMTASIRACEKRAWALVMYFPGHPFSAIPLGYYPLYDQGDGVWRSSSAFADSLLELTYDQVSDSLVIRPLFKERPLAAELYDPVRAWRDK